MTVVISCQLDIRSLLLALRDAIQTEAHNELSRQHLFTFYPDDRGESPYSFYNIVLYSIGPTDALWLYHIDDIM